MAARSAAGGKEHGVPLSTLKQCLEFLEWLNSGQGRSMQRLVVNKLFERYEKYYNSPTYKFILRNSFGGFLSHASSVYKQISNRATAWKHGSENAEQITEVLTECLSKVHSAFSLLLFHVDYTYGNVGGGRWGDFEAHSGDNGLKTYLTATDDFYIGVIVGGFSEDELQDVMGIKLAHNLNEALHRNISTPDVFTSVLFNNLEKDDWHKRDAGNVLLLLWAFCGYVEAHQENSELKRKLEDELKKKGMCFEWAKLVEHCTKLKSELSKLFGGDKESSPEPFTTTGRAFTPDALRPEAFAGAFKKWFENHWKEIGGALDAIKTGVEDLEDPSEFSPEFLYPYGIVLNRDKENEWHNGLTNLPGVLEKLGDSNKGDLKTLKEILDGEGCPVEPPPKPPAPKAAKAVVTKAEAAKPTATKTEATKTEAAKPVVTKTEATKPVVEGAKLSQNQNNGQSEAKPATSSVTKSPSSPPTGSSGASGPAAPKGEKGPQGSSSAGSTTSSPSEDAVQKQTISSQPPTVSPPQAPAPSPPAVPASSSKPGGGSGSKNSGGGAGQKAGVSSQPGQSQAPSGTSQVSQSTGASGSSGGKGHPAAGVQGAKGQGAPGGSLTTQQPVASPQPAAPQPPSGSPSDPQSSGASGTGSGPGPGGQAGSPGASQTSGHSPQAGTNAGTTASTAADSSSSGTGGTLNAGHNGDEDEKKKLLDAYKAEHKKKCDDMEATLRRGKQRLAEKQEKQQKKVNADLQNWRRSQYYVTKDLNLRPRSAVPTETSDLALDGVDVSHESSRDSYFDKRIEGLERQFEEEQRKMERERKDRISRLENKQEVEGNRAKALQEQHEQYVADTLRSLEQTKKDNAKRLSVALGFDGDVLKDDSAMKKQAHDINMHKVARQNMLANRKLTDERIQKLVESAELNRYKDAVEYKNKQEDGQRKLHNDVFSGGDVFISHPNRYDSIDNFDFYLPQHIQTDPDIPDHSFAEHISRMSIPPVSLEITAPQSPAEYNHDGIETTNATQNAELTLELDPIQTAGIGLDPFLDKFDDKFEIDKPPERNSNDPTNPDFTPKTLSFQFQNNHELSSPNIIPIPPELLVERADRDTTQDEDDPNYFDLRTHVPDRALPDSIRDIDFDHEPPPPLNVQPLEPVYASTPAINLNFQPVEDPHIPTPEDFDKRTIIKPDIELCLAPWTTQTPTHGSTNIPETELFPAEAPRTVRDMLTWLAGLKNEKHHDTLEKCINKAFGGLYDEPSQLALSVNGSHIRPTDVFDILQLTSMFAGSVLNSIAPNWREYLSSRFVKPKSSDQSEEPDCCALLCQLQDYVYACCHQLQFLKAQCSRDKLSGGWQDCNYGSDITSPNSPLQAFLTDGWYSAFDTHLFDPCNLCHKSSIRMGFKKNDLPDQSHDGRYLSSILTPSCGGSDPLLTLSSYLNCLTRRTPRTTGELVSYFHNIGNELHDYDEMKLSPLGNSLINPHDHCPDWDCLGVTDLRAVRDIRGQESLISKHNSSHYKQHPRTLSTLVGCNGDSSNCLPRMSPITYRAHALYSQSFAHTYLSWTVYLPDRLRESLEKLHYDLLKHCGNGKCTSLYSCTEAMPLLYLHGFTPPEVESQLPLKCSDVIAKLEEIVAGQPIATLMTAMDNFLYNIRQPFIFTLVALWSLAFLIFANTMLYRIDILHIRSHLIRTKTSHLIDVKALLSDSKKTMSLYDATYFDDDPNELLNLR